MWLWFRGGLGAWITGGFISHLWIEQQKKEFWAAKEVQDFCEIVCKEEVNAPWNFRPDPRMKERMVDKDNAGPHDVSYVDPYVKGSMFRKRVAKELLQATTRDVKTKDFRLFTHGFFRNAVGYEKAEEVVSSLVSHSLSRLTASLDANDAEQNDANKMPEKQVEEKKPTNSWPNMRTIDLGVADIKPILGLSTPPRFEVWDFSGYEYNEVMGMYWKPLALEQDMEMDAYSMATTMLFHAS